MPCRREEEEEARDEAEGEEDNSFLLLQQSVTLGGSADVDRLIAQIGETLQLDAAQDGQASPCAAPGPPPALPRVLAALPADKARAPARRLLRPAASAEARDPAPPGAMRCVLGERGRVRGRAAPYCVAEIAPGASALPQQPSLEGSPGTGKLSIPQPLSGRCRRSWLRNAAASRRLQQRRGSQPETRTGDDDPPRLLQQLVLSGNLIKEAVRRLHSRRLQLHAKLPAHSFLGPLSAPVPEPPLPGSPREACSDPGTCEGGRSSELGTTFLSLAANNLSGHSTNL
ncbi:proto-oncogene FRAT1-like [Arvicanthis niloticus]|uniref:proto-oncogene FRAT1-like n=1 Tax=Arvicanthis niloticus TaxID=61156 RepID=UPI001486DC62|nr:proto-oncogene FRAT1-like [Arvicanthis niloticus]XP_034343445.1 proto-oncogene FRAT1-like [Arvicanthis niloticus]